MVTRKMRAKVLRRVLVILVVFVSTCILAEKCYAPPVYLPPVAVLTVDPEYALVDEEISLDGTDSHDGDTRGKDPDITKYEWDFDYDGSTFDVDYWEDEENYSGTLGVATHTYTSEGTYTVGLKVYDNDNPAATDIETCTVYAVDDPDGQSGSCYSSFGITETSGPCPSWFTVLDSNSTDPPTDWRLVVEVEACQITGCNVISVRQNASKPVEIDMEKDDILIVWDEDPGHGSIIDFTYTNNYVTDPNISDYFRVSKIPKDSAINWVVYQVTQNGTLTINDTSSNEHDVFHLHRNRIDFDKDEGVAEPNCVSPEDEITYTICWENKGVYAHDDCYIVDWLPLGVTYPGGNWTVDPNLNLIPPDPSYDPNTHSYVYLDIGTIAPDDANCVTLDVVVNYKTEPGMYFHNVADLYSGDLLIGRATEDTLVCCWGEEPNIIYVDWTAEGDNNGTEWKDAYTDLADAISRATYSVCGDFFKIYVAEGVYDPNNTPGETFELPDNCEVYGGFKIGGCDFSQRDPMRYETILTGLIDEDAIPDVDTIVTMGDNTLLDGFTVTGAKENAVYGDGVDFIIENCIVENSDQYGIYAKNGNVTIKWCQVSENTFHGISHQGGSYTLTVENSWIMRNGEYGIYCLNSTPTVKNSIVSESSFLEFARAGIQMINPTYSPVLYNNTIANNGAEGIYFEDDHDIYNDPNNLDWPDIQNCIVYYNNPGGLQLSASLNPDTVAQYCCIQDCNEPPGTTNYNNEPGFAYTVDPNGRPDPKNYHLAYNSVCKDEGNPSLSYSGQVDIDGEGTDRKYGTYVDIGADEVYFCDEQLTEDNNIFNDLDWNADGIVNLHEFSKFSAAWLGHDPNDTGMTTDPNDIGEPNYVDPISFVNWNPTCDLDDDYAVDLADFSLFCDEWLWAACWKLEQINEEMVMFGGETMMAPMSMESFAIEPVEPDLESAELTEKELVELVKGIYGIMSFLDESFQANDLTAGELDEYVDFFESILLDLKEQYRE